MSELDEKLKRLEGKGVSFNLADLEGSTSQQILKIHLTKEDIPFVVLPGSEKEGSVKYFELSPDDFSEIKGENDDRAHQLVYNGTTLNESEASEGKITEL